MIFLKNLFRLFDPKWNKDEVPFPASLLRIKSIKVTPIENGESICLSDTEIEDFLLLFSRGSCKSMLKCLSSYVVDITHSEGTSRYFAHASSIGPLPGGLKQVIFTPWKGSFSAFLGEIYVSKK